MGSVQVATSHQEDDLEAFWEDHKGLVQAKGV